MEEIYNLFGVTKCAKDGCSLPGVVRFDFTDEEGPVWIFLCPMCLVEVKKCFEEVSAIMEERREAIELVSREHPLLPPITEKK